MEKSTDKDKNQGGKKRHSKRLQTEEYDASVNVEATETTDATKGVGDVEEATTEKAIMRPDKTKKACKYCLMMMIYYLQWRNPLYLCLVLVLAIL